MTTCLTILPRMLGFALLAMLLLAMPAMAQDVDDDSRDDSDGATGTADDSGFADRAFSAPDDTDDETEVAIGVWKIQVAGVKLNACQMDLA